jgi:LysR family nitrogen assimilation transcriptional regulator
LDLRQLKYFVTIVESKTLTEASRRLHIVQPALSQRLAALEADLGVQLLVRGRSGLAMTEAGQELYTRALLILKQADTARAAVKEKAGVASGRVAIGVLRSLAPMIGATLFSTIRAELPAVQPDIVVGYSDELLQQLRATRLDTSLGVQADASTLDGFYLYSEGVYLLGAAHFFDAGSNGVCADDLRDLPLMVRSTKGQIHRVLETAANVRGFSLNVVGSIEDQASVLALCNSGTVATYVPESTAKRLVAQGGLVARPILEEGLVRKVFLYSHPDVPKTGAVIAVEDIVSRVVADYVADADTSHHHTPM